MSWYITGDDGTYELDEDFNTLTSDSTSYEKIEQTTDGDIFVGDGSGTLHKLDSNLDVVWEFSARGDVEDIVWDDSRVYIATRGYAAIHAVDISDGSEVWDEYAITNISPGDDIRSLAIDLTNGWLYGFPQESGDPSYINKYDATDGTLLEDVQYSSPGGGYGFYAMNYYEEEGLLIGADNEGYWMSADVSDGTLPSSLNGGDNYGSDYGYSQNRIDSSGELFATNRSGEVGRFDVNGNLQWSTTVPSGYGDESSVDQNHVLHASRTATTKLDKSDGAVLDTSSTESTAVAAIPRYDADPDAWGSSVEEIEATPVGATSGMNAVEVKEFIDATPIRADASMGVPVESYALSSTQASVSFSMATTSLDWVVAIDATPIGVDASMSTPSLEYLDALASTQTSVSSSMNAPVEGYTLSSTQASVSSSMNATSLDWHSVVEASVSTVSVSMAATSLDWQYALRAAQSSAVASMNWVSVSGEDFVRAAHASAQASPNEGEVSAASTSASPFSASALMNRAGLVTEIDAGRFTATGLMNNVRSGKARFRGFGEKSRASTGDSTSEAVFPVGGNDSTPTDDSND